MKSLPGLVLWVEGSTGVTKDASNAVSRWSDQSGQGDDLTPVGAAPLPKYASTGLASGPAVDFTGMGATLATAIDANTSFGGDMLVEAVAIEPTTTMQYDAIVTIPQANQVRFDMLNNGGCDLIIVGGINPVGDVACTQTGLAGTPHLFGFRRTNTASNPTIEVRIDGAAAGSGSSPLYNVSLVGLELYAGTYAEAVAVNGTTSSTDLAALEAYLKGKYGL